MAQSVSCRPVNMEDRILPVHVGFVVNKVALGQVSLQLTRLSSVNVIPPMFHACFILKLFLSEGQAGAAWGT